MVVALEAELKYSLKNTLGSVLADVIFDSWRQRTSNEGGRFFS